MPVLHKSIRLTLVYRVTKFTELVFHNLHVDMYFVLNQTVENIHKINLAI